MRNLEGVIIDMEGTLINGASILRKSYVSCLTGFGVPYTEADHRLYIGKNDRHIFHDLKNRHPNLITPLPMLAKIRNDHYERLLQSNVVLQPGALEFLDNLKRHGIPIALASYATKPQINGMLGALKLEHVFNVIVSNEMVARVKPEPDIYQLAVHYLGVQSDACIVFESSEIGVEAASNAGTRVVAVPTSATEYEDYTLADLQIDSFEGIDLEDLAMEVALELP